VSLTLLVLPGDGIGPEITDATVAVLEHLNARLALGLRLERQALGLESLRSHGTTLREETLAAVRAADGTILAPLSTYEYPPPERGGVNPSAAIRRSLDLYANIRPARVFQGVPAPARDMDLVVVRENTEGFYADRSMHLGVGEFMPTPDLAIAVRKITRAGSERIARSAFELAMRRRRHVTVVHKANVLRVSDGLFLEAVHDVAREFPEVVLEERLIDAMTALLVRAPSEFDVIVTSNMYGDILSDEATELAGGIGLGGALNAGSDHAIAQATHGSAPDIAGQGKANPTALMLSTAMLLGWLGARHRRPALEQASQRLEQAVARALADPATHTPDLGGRNDTRGFADAVLAALG
jgi:3-isopropylmalate dehydrogenase